MKLDKSVLYFRVVKSVFISFGFLIFFAPGYGATDDENFIELGEKGIEAFRQGNLILAMDLLNKSAVKGYAPAQTTLAYIMDQAEENDRAFEWFELAAKQNYAAAQFGLGNMYAKGEGTPKDPLIAGQWIKKSALQQHAPAMRAYAYALEYGNLGFEMGPDQALHWYRLCSDAGDLVCTRRLVQAYETGDLGEPVDEDRANELRRRLNQVPGEG
jgi:TPR repeat protein